jgi:hypothetical protein
MSFAGDGDRVFVVLNYDIGNPIQAQNWIRKVSKRDLNI